MFGLFGNKSKKSAEGELVPALKQYVVQIHDTTKITFLAIAHPLLTFGMSAQAYGKGPAGITQAINSLSRQLEQAQKALGSLGSSIMDVGIPQQPQQQYDFLVEKIGDFATTYTNKGYSFEEVGVAMMNLASDIAKAIDKDGLLNIGLLRQELARLRERYKREQFSQTATGERTTDAAIDALLRAEAAGFTLTVSNDRTFILSKGSAISHYLRSNAEIAGFAALLKQEQDTAEASRNPVDRLIEQGQTNLRKQNLEAAIESFSAALRIKPNDRDLYFNRGVAWSNKYHNKGHNPDALQHAIDDYTRSLEIDPDFAQGYFQRAGLYTSQGRDQAAIADYDKAIDGNHLLSSSYYCRALLWQKQGAAGKAKTLADFTKAIEFGSKDDQFMALMSRSEAHQQYGELELALDDLNAADAYYPENPPGLFKHRADIYLKMGRVREAVVDLGNAIEATSPLASAEFLAELYDQRAQCKAKLGEPQQAQQDLTRAREVRSGKRR
ncbi:tetratricopeptide repeat protein [Bradyrhizobium yuanmingense]|uniref:tetratricopeptide repeat protein n=1 Tax=Bradyrhizobium yuanmingense TaxID=108015 RepID=UPI0023B94462|nr:tetratricopeptide repeat protein [Bradyrhizobium yuanmingense]MDF0515752.1 tetratricopeptide repeat protein [Bradyrhizobium yuanmingense]